MDIYHHGYVRDDEGTWQYLWGAPVPHSIDLVLAMVPTARSQTSPFDLSEPFETLDDSQRLWLEEAGFDPGCRQVRQPRRRTAAFGDLIVGMLAPELHPAAMMTVGDIAQFFGVSKGSVDSYRYRGYLSEPQAHLARTPLWSFPIIEHWRATRPGAGWRSDLYGDVSTHADQRANR